MSEFASTDLIRVSYLKESDYGVTDTTGTPRNLRITGQSLDFGITKTESNEITPDRMTTDLIETGASAAGGVNIELSYREFDDLLRMALMAADWDVYGEQAEGVGQGIGELFTATFTANTIVADVAPTAESAFTTLQKGQWVQVRCPGSPNHLKHVRLSSTVAPTATLLTVDAATPLAVDNTGRDCEISSSRVTNGVTKEYITIERAHLDISQFFQFKGMTVNKMSFSMASSAIVTGSVEFMGKDGTRQTATVFGNAPAGSFTYDVMNAVTGVGHILEGGAPMVGTRIKKLDLTIENNLRGQDAMGERGNAGIGLGSLKVSGSMEVYLADGTLYDKFLNNTRTSLHFVAHDNAKNGYAFQLPGLKYGDAKVNAGGKNSDCMITVPFTGIKDPVTQKVLIVDRMGE